MVSAPPTANLTETLPAAITKNTVARVFKLELKVFGPIGDLFNSSRSLPLGSEI